MKKKSIITLLTLFISCLIFIIILNIIQKPKLYISEVLASNSNTIQDNYGNYSDYIEIYNKSNHKINLKDFHLSDSEYETNKWTFPNIEIKPKEYLLIYASGLNECNNKKCHTNFKLSSKGEVITLSDPNGNILSKIEYPKLDKDISYGYNGKKYVIFEKPTPGKENSTKEIITKISNENSIIINEYMTHNTRTNYDEYGNYYDWVELYNYSNKNIVLENIYITDNANNLTKHRIKKIEIKAKDYLLLYFSKDTINYQENNYIPFGLSDTDKEIIISDGNKIIDKVEIVQLKENISYGKVDNSWKYFTNPTPGKENNTAYFDSLGGNNGNT